MKFLRSLLPLGFALLVILGLGGGILWLWRELSPQQHPPGPLITDGPTITYSTKATEATDRNNQRYNDLGKATIRGRVLGVRRYQDQWSSLSPIDVTLGWHEFSNSDVLKGVKISQEGRRYRVDLQSSPLSPDSAYRSSGNFAIIPNDPALSGLLSNLRVGDLIEVQGNLVDLLKEDGASPTWSSTPSFTLNSPDATFILLVSSIKPIGSQRSHPAKKLDHARESIAKAELARSGADENAMQPPKLAPAAKSPSLPLGTAADLKQWYEALLAMQKSLDPNDAEAVNRYNDEARRYMDVAHPKKALKPVKTPHAKAPR